MTAPRLLPVASPRDTVRAIAPRLRARRILLVAALTLFTAGAAAALIPALAIGRIVDLVLAGEPATAATVPALVIAGAAAVQGLLGMAAPALTAHAFEPALAELREDVVDHILHAPADVVERAGTGDVVARIDGDVAAVTEAVQRALPEIATAALTIALTVVGLGALDWRLALAALLATPIQLHTVRWYLPRARPVYAAERAAAGARTDQLLETVGGADTLRSFRMGDRHLALVEERSSRAADLAVESTRLGTRFFGRLNVAELTGLIAVIASGYLLTRNQTVTVGTVAAAALLYQRIFDPVNTLLHLLDEAQAAAAALGRLAGVTEIAIERPPDRTSTAPPSIEVRGLTFAYDGGPAVLHDLDLRIEAGERVAVVGASGAGKSTLARILAGLLPAPAGTARVGGEDVAHLAELGGRLPVALVTQEIHVHAGTVAEDLRLVAPDATDTDLDRALRRVGATWTATLPDGLQTLVGDGGHPLDPAQAQQLALARLVLADPAVAILDEATADAGSAHARTLEHAADAATDGRTTVVIAHRLTQATTADRIVVLDRGRVVQTGTHAELAGTAGTYARLWRAWTAANAHARER